MRLILLLGVMILCFLPLERGNSYEKKDVLLLQCTYSIVDSINFDESGFCKFFFKNWLRSL